MARILSYAVGRKSNSNEIQIGIAESKHIHVGLRNQPFYYNISHRLYDEEKVRFLIKRYSTAVFSLLFCSDKGINSAQKL